MQEYAWWNFAARRRERERELALFEEAKADAAYIRKVLSEVQAAIEAKKEACDEAQSQPAIVFNDRQTRSLLRFADFLADTGTTAELERLVKKWGEQVRQECHVHRQTKHDFPRGVMAGYSKCASELQKVIVSDSPRRVPKGSQ